MQTGAGISNWGKDYKSVQNIGHLNTNSLHNKFDTLKLLVKNSLDIDISIYRNNISINRSRFSLDHSLEGQFLMDGFTPPWRMNRNAKGGGIALYVKEDIPRSSHQRCSVYVCRKLRICSHLLKKFLMENFIFCPVLDSLSSKYDNYILMGDFNAKISNNFVDIFCGFDSLKSLIKKSKWFKDPDNPTCIALILTNRQKSLQNSTNIETGYSDFHKLIVTILKSYFKKLEPKKLLYRDFKNFSKQ